jgi:hypothetical protein
MGTLGGPSIVTSGLVLHLDATNIKSFRGEPTVNLVAGGGLVGMSGITLTFISMDGLWKKYSMSGTFSNGTYPYIMYVTATTFTGGLQYSTKCTIRTNVLYKFNYFGTGINYVNQPMTNGGVMLSIINSDDSRTVSRSGFVYTSTTSQFGYLLTNPINGTGFSPITDFVWIKDLQVEQMPYTTPYVNGTRGNSVETGGGWEDRSGNGYNGTLTNGPTFNSLNGGSIVFDGINDYITRNVSINTGTNFTVSAWIYPTILGTTRRGIVGNSYTYGNRVGWFFSTGGGVNNTFFLSIGADNVFNIAPANTLNINEWVYITATCQNGGGTIILYKNGQVVANSNGTAGTITYTTNQFNVGYRLIGGTTDPYTGRIASIQVHNRVLSQQEVLQNYNATKSRFNL